MPLEIFLVGPLLALAVLALIAVAADLRLARPAASRADDFGLLRPVALLDDRATAAVIRTRLARLGIRSTIGTGRDGFLRVLVFDDEFDRARDAV